MIADFTSICNLLTKDNITGKANQNEVASRLERPRGLLLKKDEDFDKLPETRVIFITENDVMEKGLPLYPVERCFLGRGEKYEDGLHIWYVNSAYRGDTPIGQLMHDFSCTNAHVW